MHNGKMLTMLTKKTVDLQAKAMFELYKAMPGRTRRQVKKLILESELSFADNDLTELSTKAMDEVWNTEENEGWDTFFVENK